MTDPEQPSVPPPETAPPEIPPPPATPERYPFWSWQDLLLLGVATVPLFFAAAVIVSGVFWSVGFAPRAAAVVPITAQFLFYGLWFLLVYELIRFRYDRPFWRSLAFVEARRWLARGAWWGLLTALAAILLALLLRPPPIKTPMDRLLQDPVSVVLMVFFGVTLGPLCEELAFRGLLLPMLVRSLGAPAGILVTATPFTLLHGIEYAWSWQHLAAIFLAGSAFGWIRWHTGSTAASTISHGFYNLTFFITFLVGRGANAP